MKKTKLAELDTRASFWGSQHDFGGGTIPDPFTKHVELFKGKKVLEIGPGNGRQFTELSKLTDQYTVADISQEVLSKNLYASVTRKQIESYEQDLGDRYDVVCFWYVLHHVLPSEVEAFLGFVAKHVKSGGHVVFNTLQPEQFPKDNLKADGMKTSPHTLAFVQEETAKHFEVLDTENKSLDCFVILGRKL